MNAFLRQIASLATREVRLLPVLILAAGALFLLKGVQIAVQAPGAINGVRVALAQEKAEAVQDEDGEPGEVSGALSDAEAPGEDAGDDVAPRSAEEAINARLADRRRELDKFEADLKMRENLLRATEMRIEQRLAELKKLETRLNASLSEREEREQERFKNLVEMYQAMKPKDAAKVFDRLDTALLVEVVSGIDPRTMAEIVSNMSAEGAERLTVALMNRAVNQAEGMQVEDLPQIVGTKPAS